MKRFETNEGFVFSEEDSFENGCLSNTQQSWIYDVDFKADTVKELLQKIKEHFEVDDQDISLNSCDELGRIDIQKLKNKRGYFLTPSEIEEWKKGKIQAWSVCYTYTIYEVERKIVDLVKE